MWIPRMALILNLKREEEAHENRAKLVIYQGDTVLGERDVNLRFKPETDICKIVLNFNVAIPSPGELVFKLSVNGDDTELLRFPVEQPPSSVKEGVLTKDAIPVS
jgi:hypothetical protein